MRYVREARPTVSCGEGKAHEFVEHEVLPHRLRSGSGANSCFYPDLSSSIFYRTTPSSGELAVA